jgi:hypothetical protein
MKLFTKEVEFEYFEELISRINKYKAKVNNGKRV